MGLALHLAVLLASVCIVTSIAVALCSRLFRASLERLEPRARVRVLFSFTALPALMGFAAVLAVLAPHQWFGGVDHCLHHPGHLHFCLVHGAHAPAAPVALVGVAWVMWCSWGSLRALGRAVRGARALRGVIEAARRVDVPSRTEVFALPSDSPVAFTAGMLRPRVVVSESVLTDLTRWRAVMEHERAHADARDPLVRWLASGLASFHVPWLGSRLTTALRDAQETAADESAAVAVGSRVEVAETLVEWMRWNHVGRALGVEAGVGFDSLTFQTRVERLLDAPVYRAGPSVRHLSSLLLAFGVVAAFHTFSLHHAAETVFGLLAAH